MLYWNGPVANCVDNLYDDSKQKAHVSDEIYVIFYSNSGSVYHPCSTIKCVENYWWSKKNMCTDCYYHCWCYDMFPYCPNRMSMCCSVDWLLCSYTLMMHRVVSLCNCSWWQPLDHKEQLGLMPVKVIFFITFLHIPSRHCNVHNGGIRISLTSMKVYIALRTDLIPNLFDI